MHMSYGHHTMVKESYKKQPVLFLSGMIYTIAP